MKVHGLELVFLPSTLTSRKAYYTGIALNPHNRMGLKIHHRKEEADGMTRRWMEALWLATFWHIVPKKLKRHQQDSFPGLCLHSHVFLLLPEVVGQFYQRDS